MSAFEADFHAALSAPGGSPPARTFLLADGRGGASQLTLAGLAARAWHAAWAPAAALGAELDWVSPGLGLETGGRARWLPESPGDLARTPADIAPEEFDEDPLPRWRWRVGEARVEALLVPQRGDCAVVLRVRVFGAREGSRLLLRPAFRARQDASGALPQIFAGETPRSRMVRVPGAERSLEWLHPEGEVIAGPGWDRDAREAGRWFRPATLAFALPAGESTREFRVGLEGVPFVESGRVLESEEKRLRALAAPRDARGPAAARLARSLDRYVARDTDGRTVLPDRLPGDEGPGLLGTSRALAPALLAFGRFDEAREVLAGAARRVHEWLGSPEPAREPDQDLLGAALCEWVLAGWRFELASGDAAFVKSELAPVWREMLELAAAGHVPALQFAPSAGAAELPFEALERGAAGHAAWCAMAACAGFPGRPVERADVEREAGRLRVALRAAYVEVVRARSVVARHPAGFASRLSAHALRALGAPAGWLEPADEATELARLEAALWNPHGVRLGEAVPGLGREDDDLAARLPALLGSWRRAAARIAPGEALDSRLDAARECAAASLDRGVVGHPCPVLDPDPPHGPHSEADPATLERAHLETDAEALGLFLPAGPVLHRTSREVTP